MQIRFNLLLTSRTLGSSTLHFKLKQNIVLNQKVSNKINNYNLIKKFFAQQDYGECTPTAEKNLIFPRFPASSDRPSLPMSQLVRKLSEVEGISPSSHNARVNAVLKTSLDEGVSLDIDDSQQLIDFQQQQLQQQQQQKQQQQHPGHLQTDRIPGKALSFDSASLSSCGSGGMLLTGDASIDRALR